MKSTYKVNKIYRCGPHHAEDVKVDHTKEMIEYLCKELEKETGSIHDPNLNIERTSPHIATSHDSIMSDLFVCLLFCYVAFSRQGAQYWMCAFKNAQCKISEVTCLESWNNLRILEVL